MAMAMDRIFQVLQDATPLQLSALAFSLASLGYVCAKTISSSPPKGLVYPPGPPRDPIIGNLRNFPKTNLYEGLCQLQGLYGDIVFLQLPGINMVNVNSLHLAHELLAKRANTTGGRKMGYMAQVLIGWGWSVVLRNADAAHLSMKRMLRRGIGPQRVASHDPLLDKCSHRLLLELEESKKEPLSTIQDVVGRMLVEMTYGEELWANEGKQLVNLNHEIMEIINKTNNKLWFVDIFPSLRFIPSWMPGAEFRRRGLYSTALTSRLRTWPFERVLEMQQSGKLGHCLAADLIDQFGTSEEVQDSLAVLYFGGVDTTSASITSFILCMVLFPHVAQKVQAEIDLVMGTDRLPKASDRPHLPYTEAAWKESLRWSPTGPLGLPHMNTEDEVIDGYFIPKGSIINANIGFMLNDPRIWGDPRSFRPERHLQSYNPSADLLPNPCVLSFGFGHRVCPGMHLADRVGFQSAASIMAVYNVLQPAGRTLDPRTVEYQGTMIRMPKNFECRFVPRNTSLLPAIRLSGSL